MRTSAGRGDAGEALSVRAARLLHTRSRFHRDQTGVEPDRDAERYLGENGGTGAVPSVNDVIREVETAVGRQFIKSIDLAFAGLERGPNVIVRKILQLHPACAQSIPGQLLKSVIG